MFHGAMGPFFVKEPGGGCGIFGKTGNSGGLRGRIAGVIGRIVGAEAVALRVEPCR